MGQQFADEGLIRALTSDPAPHEIRQLDVTGMRSRLPADQLLPLAKLGRAPWPLQLIAGAWAYRGGGLVHRLDLGLPPATGPEIITVHDLAGLHFPDEGALPRFWMRALQRATAVVCPSRFSADDVERHSGRDDVHVIPNGLDPVFVESDDVTSQRASEPVGIEARYVLHTGGATLRKNLGALAAAWPSVRRENPDIALLMCGPAHARRAQLFGALDGVQIMGRVARKTVVSLIRSAAVVVVPSTYEGYGLPVLEAMASGVPVVASAAGSLPEVAGPGAILVEPTADGLAEGLCRALDGVDAQTLADARELARSRTWSRAASSYKALYSSILG